MIHIFLSPFGLQAGCVYQNWEDYRSLFTTYEMDKDYVKFYEEMSSKLQVASLHETTEFRDPTISLSYFS